MSFEPPAGILDIGNATLRVGKLEVTETSGLNQGLLNIVKNDLLITETTEYTTNRTWGIKLPTTWVGEFEVKGASSKYVEFNFYNEGSTSNALGYTLNFKDTSLSLMYDTSLSENRNILTTATIPTIVGTYRKVNIFFERGVIAVSIDGARVLYFKESDTYNQIGVASRVVSTTGGAFVNAFFESDHGGNSGFKNLRIVNGRFISDKTSNVSFIGSLGVGVHSPKESLDIRGNMHLTRVSNVSQVSVDSNVVTEYTGPHDRPLRKYPEVALTADAQLSAGGYKGYIVNQSSFYEGSTAYAWQSFAGNQHWLSSGTAFDGGDDVFNDTNGPWISIQLPTKIKLEYLEFYVGSGRPGQTVAGGSVYASNDGSDWTNIGSLDNLGNYTDTAPAHVKFTHTTRYDRYLLHVTSVSLYTYAHIERLSFYGYEEGSGSLDTTLKTVYNVPATTGTQLEVYYDGRETSSYPESGVTVTDISPNTNNGTLNGGVGFDTTYKAFTFDGTNDYIEGAVTAETGAWSHTIAFWIKIDQIPSSSGMTVFQIKDSSLADNVDAATSTSPHLVIDPGTGYINNAFQGNPGQFLDDNGNRLVAQTGVWQHYVVQYDASNGGTNYRDRKLIINGNKEYYPAGGTTTALSMVASNKLFIGCLANASLNGPGYFFDGSIANFRLYSKVLNADQVKELYDYQKDYFLGSKSQVTLYKGHLGVGVTEPSGQLELAGDERIQEYPPRAMTGYETLVEGHGVFTVYSTGGLYNNGSGDNLPWRVFDKITGSFNDGTSWVSEDAAGAGAGGNYNNNGSSGYGGSNRLASNTPLGEYLVICLPYPIALTGYSLSNLSATNGYGAADFPRDYIIYGSSDGVNWEVVDSRSDQEAGGLAPAAHVSAGYLVYTNNYTVSRNNKVYSKFAIVITDINAKTWYDYTSGTVNASYAAISEWRLFGTPGPTTIDKGSLSLTRSLDVPRVSRYDVDTETPRYEKLVVDFDTTVNSSPIDISGNGNHGTFYNGASYSPADKAFVFDGTTGCKISGTHTLSGSNPVHTISGWVKKESANTGWEYIFTIGTSSQGLMSGFTINSGNLYFSIYGDGVAFTTPNNFNYNWQHIVGVYTGGTSLSSSNFLIYVNGVKVQTTTGVGNTFTLTGNQVTLGTNTSGGEMFTGKISNFKLYNVALEPSEVKKLYQLGRTGRSMVISDTAVGIGKVPEAQLDVRGNLNVDGVITTPQRPVFYAYVPGGAAYANGYKGIVEFTTTRINVGGCFNTSDYKFYAPITGYYWFEFQILARYGSGNGNIEISLYKNGVNIASRALAYAGIFGTTDHDNLCFSIPVQMNAGDNIYPGVHDCAAGVNAYYGEDLGHFSGFFIG